MTLGPLILGATGRVGRAFRALSSVGHWPGATPLWHGRAGADLWTWDMLAPPPPLPGLPLGIILLAGPTSGSQSVLQANTTLALTALALARDRGIWPLVVCSTSAVYGRAAGPCHEGSAPVAPNPYGLAKLDMEAALRAALRPGDRVTCLRIANVAGCGALFDTMARGPVSIDRFADGHTPRRSHVGPLTLARALTGLIAQEQAGSALPFVLNLGQPGLVEMAALAEAAGATWHPVPAPATALPELWLDTAVLATRMTLPPATAAGLIAEAHLAGWAAAGSAA